MTLLTTPLGIAGLLSIFFMLFILANLSRRLGTVTKMKPYYRGFYVAMGILVLPLIVRMVLSPAGIQPDYLHSPAFYLFAYHLPFALAIVISCIVAWRYWGWLFRESQASGGQK